MENIEDELEEFRRMLADRFSGDPKIGTVARGRKVMFLTLFALLCELEPLSGNKMITEVHHFDLEMLKSFLDLVNKRLIREGLAKESNNSIVTKSTLTFRPAKSAMSNIF